MKSTCEGKLIVENALIAFNHLKTIGLLVRMALLPNFTKHFGICLLVESLNYSYDHGELSNTQKQTIIKLIEKKGKDKRNISNWRPISLIKVDAKIGSEPIATRQ